MAHLMGWGGVGWGEMGWGENKANTVEHHETHSYKLSYETILIQEMERPGLFKACTFTYVHINLTTI